VRRSDSYEKHFSALVLWSVLEPREELKGFEVTFEERGGRFIFLLRINRLVVTEIEFWKSSSASSDGSEEVARSGTYKHQCAALTVVRPMKRPRETTVEEVNGQLDR
jgi:hypothetical protein